MAHDVTTEGGSGGASPPAFTRTPAPPKARAKLFSLSEGPSQNSDRKIEVPINEEPVSEVHANETDVEVGESEAEESESRDNSTTVEVYVEQNTEVPIIPKPADNNNNTNEVPANPKDKIYAEKENNYQFYEDGE